MSSTRRLLWLSLSVPLVLSVVLDSSAGPARAKSEDAVNSRLLGNVEVIRLYPPESGLRLLEDILGRIRSSPQLAINSVQQKQNLRLQGEEQASARQSRTDYRLAIKPGDNSNSLKGRGRAMYADSLQADSAVKSKGIWERDGEGPAVASLPENILPSYEKSSGNSGLWEKDEAPQMGALSAESQRRLTRSMGGFLDATNRFAEAGKMANQLAQNAPASAPAPSPAQVGGKLLSYGNAAGGGGNGGAIQGFSNGVRGASAPPPPQARKDSALKKSAREPSMERSAAVADKWTAAQNEALQTLRTEAKAKPSGAYDYKTSMLPPNVISGIPMVRLGCSEAQACRALNIVGSAQKKHINGWTIWSYNRGSIPVLQVYMRHQQVEALRIFDSNLISPDLGIRLGDDVSRVKERFGEPAFMLTEPIPGVGQNYVYPISQIGFLFSRPTPTAPPEVAGLLIFNVK